MNNFGGINSNFTRIEKTGDKIQNFTSIKQASSRSQINIGSNGGIFENKQKGQIRKISGNQGNLSMQGNRGQGKLITDKQQTKSPTGNQSIASAQYPKKDGLIQLSPLRRLRQQFFFYSKIIANRMDDKDCQKLSKIFQFFTTKQQKRKEQLQDLKIVGKRIKLMKIEQNRYFVDLKQQEQHEAADFFTLIISKLMQQSKYLSFQGARRLSLFYIDINKVFYCENEKFNLHLIYKQCKIKIINESSSGSIKNEPFFKKIIKQIIFLKDIIFYEYQKFIIRLKILIKDNQNNIKILKQGKFYQYLIKNLWISFQNIIKSHHCIIYLFQLKIILQCINQVINIYPKAIDRNYVNQNIINVLSQNYQKILVFDQTYQRRQSTTKLTYLIDQLMLKLLLKHPFTFETAPITQLQKHKYLNRYSFINFIKNRQPSLSEKLPIIKASSAIFIQQMIRANSQFSQYTQIQNHFIFYYIYQILKDDPQRFWNEPNQYRNIRLYLGYLEQQIQNIFQMIIQQNNRYEYNEDYEQQYINIIRFFRIFSLLIFPVYKKQSTRQKLEQLFRNRQNFNNFLQFGIKILISQNQRNQNYWYEIINIQSIYEFLYLLIINDYNYYINLKGRNMLQNNKNIEYQLFYNYLEKYRQQNLYDNNLLIAFNKLIQLNTKQVHIIMNYYDKMDNLSKLDSIISILFSKKQNIILLAKNIILIYQYYPQYIQHTWIKKLKLFRSSYQKYHIQNNIQYALALQYALQHIKNNPRSFINIQQYFDFSFASQYINNAFQITYQSIQIKNNSYNNSNDQWANTNKQIFCKHIKGKAEKPVVTAIKLLKTMTQLYIKEIKSNEGQVVPFEIRRLLQSQNKDGDHQVVGKNSALSHYGISFHYALLTIFVSKQFLTDYDLKKQYPNLKNEILQILINLNFINLHLKYETNLKLSIYNNKLLQSQINKRKIFKNEIYDVIIGDPTYLGFQYLFGTQGIDFIQKQVIFKSIKLIDYEQTFENMRNKSRFINFYWKQIQNPRLNIDEDKGWMIIIQQMDCIKKYLNRIQDINNLLKIQQQYLIQILYNIYNFTEILKQTNKKYYIKYYIKYYDILLDIKYYNLYLNSNSNNNNQNKNILLNLFISKSFIYNNQNQFNKQKKLHKKIYDLLCLLLNKKYYNKKNQIKIMELIQFGLAFLIELKPDFQQYKWIQIRRLFNQRPDKTSPMLTKEIIILILLNSQVPSEFRAEDVEFNNRDWLLLMNIVQPNAKLALTLIGQLFNIYQMHPVFFASTCHYLTRVAKTKYLQHLYQLNTQRSRKTFVRILMDILKKSIQAQKHYYSILIISILTQIFMNTKINKTVRQNFCSEIRVSVLTFSLLKAKVADYFQTIVNYYSRGISNNLKSWTKQQKSSSQLTFSEKQQLLAFLRILTFIYFMKPEQKNRLEINKQDKSQCELTQDMLLQAMLQFLPLLGNLIKDDREKDILLCNSSWQQKLKSFNLQSIIQQQIGSSTLRQYSSERNSEFWKNKNCLEIFHEISNIQLSYICSLWLSGFKLNENSAVSKKLLESKLIEKYFENGLKYLQILKKKIIFLKQQNEKLKNTMKYISQKIYMSSRISKQLLFTNTNYFSSKLLFNYDQIKRKFIESYQLIYSFINNFLIHQKQHQKQFIKLLDRFVRSCNQIQSLTKIAPSNRSENNTTFSRSNTYRSQK